MKKRVLINFMEMMLEKGKMSKVLGEKYTLINLLRAEIGNYCDNNNLRGYSYSNSKDYFMNVCLPALRQFEECCKVFEECADTIKIKYVECFGLVHSLPTDTDELEAMLSELEIELKSLKAERDSFQFDIYTGTHSSSSSVHMASYESICSNIIAVENRIRKIKEFIDKMYEFDNSAQLIFNRFFEEYDKVKMIADRLRADRGGRSIFGCCERSHWTVSDSLKQDIVDMQMSLLLKRNGHINWSEAKKMMGAGDDVSAMVLPFLLSQYDLPADTSYDDFLLYLSAYDPDVINKYFSKVYNDGEIDYDYIAELMWRDPSKVSDAQQAMLIAAFVSMNDDEKERFVEISYSFSLDKEEMMENGFNAEVHCQLSPVFVNMTEKYGTQIINAENYVILESAKEPKTELEREGYRDVREQYQVYNIMSAFCVQEDMTDKIHYEFKASVSREEFDLRVSITDLDGSGDPLDKTVSIYMQQYELGNAGVIGSELDVMGYRMELDEVRAVYSEKCTGSKAETIVDIVATEAATNIPYVGLGLGLARDAVDICQVVSGTDTQSMIIKTDYYINALNFYGIEGQAIINEETGQIIINTPYVNEKVFYENLNYWANIGNDMLEEQQKQLLMEALNSIEYGMDTDTNEVLDMMQNESVVNDLTQYVYNQYYN